VKHTMRMLVLIAVIAALWIPAPGLASNPISYGWGYDNPGNVVGVEGQQYVVGQTSGYRWVGGQVGICKSGTAACSSSFIETGIAYGTDSSSQQRQYVRYSDAGGTDTEWWDSANLTSYAVYLLRIEYDGGADPTAWKVYRAPCSSVNSCQTPTLIKSVDETDVDFSSGDSVYAGAAGQGTQPPLTLVTEIDVLRYKSGSTWSSWDWYPDQYTRSSTSFCISRVTGYLYTIGVGTQVPCP
jgi:hypothetical protein